MIQRIQTIFLALAALAALATFGLPFATTPAAEASSALFTDADFDVQDSPVLMGAFGLAGLALLVAIFLFSNRKLQMNITKIGLLMAGIGIGAAGMLFYKDTVVALAQPALGIALPVLTGIFGYMANHFIKKDEKLVRSIDRLR